MNYTATVLREALEARFQVCLVAAIALAVAGIISLNQEILYPFIFVLGIGLGVVWARSLAGDLL